MMKKGIGRGHGRRQFALEQLESRAMLAGEVNVVKSGENLDVTGDKNNNVVAIVDVGNDRFAVIGVGTGLKGSNPTVNGYEYKIVTGIRNINVDLKEGNDALAVGNDAAALVQAGVNEGVISSGSASAVQSALESFLGSFAYGEFQLDKQLKIRMSSGNDDVLVVDADIGRRIDADLGNGNNSFFVDPTEIGDDLILRAGSGADVVTLRDTYIHQMLDVNLGDGENSFGMSESLDFGDASHVGESVVLHTGKHADVVEFGGTDVEQDFIVRTGGGNDIVGFFGKSFLIVHLQQGTIGRTADINTGAGNDEVDICDADIGIRDGGDEIGWSLKINTEDGIDSVMVGCEGFELPTPDAEQVDLPEFGDFSVNIGDDLIVLLGEGNDGFNGFLMAVNGGAFIENTGVVDNLEVHGGAGHDDAAFTLVAVGHDAFLRGNSGNDDFEFTDVVVGNNLDYDAGEGDDNGDLQFVEARRIFCNWAPAPMAYRSSWSALPRNSKPMAAAATTA